MGNDATTAIITDSTFVGLQKCRLLASSQPPMASKHSLLATSSKYQISFAVSNNNTILSWNSASIHNLRRTHENANVEYTQLQMRTTQSGAEDIIITIAVNSDGTLLAILVNNSSGTFAKVYNVTAFSTQFNSEVYPLCVIKIGQNSDSKAVCLEWNPAVPDTLAASASDNSLMVARISTKSPYGYTLVGNATLGATAYCISWSPKGKQLVVGDSVGKISQLKPELEVVRATLMPSEVTKQTDGLVCGLCWLSTTEWFVTYAFLGVADIQAYLLTLKKDKPASWISLPDISYCNPSSSLNHRVLCDTSLLVAWNVVFITCSKTSELFVLGKVGDSWKIWLLDEDSRVDLPCSANRGDTFPLGMTVDLSSTTEVIICPDGTRRHPPSPILMIFTTDGVLISYNTVSMNPAHPPCQIHPSTIDPSQIKMGMKPENTPAVQAPETCTPVRSLLGISSKAKPDASPVGTPQQAFTNTPSFATVTPDTPQQLFAKPPSSSTVTAVTSQQLFTKTPSSTSVTTAPQGIFSKTPLAATKDVSVMDRTTVDSAPNAEKEASLKSLRQQYNAAVEEARSEWSSLVDDMKSLHIGIRSTQRPLKEYEATNDESTSIVLRELSKLLDSLDNYCEDVEDKLRSGVVRGADALESITYCEQDISSFLADLDSFDRNERMVRVVKAMDFLKEHFASGKEMLDTLKKSSGKKSVTLSSWVVWHNKDIRQIMKAVSSSLKSIRCRIETMEDDCLRSQQSKKISYLPPTLNEQGKEPAPLTVNILKVQKVPNATGEKLERRKKMRELVRAKDNDPPKLRSMVPLPFFEGTKQTLPDKARSNDLLRDVMSKLASPRVVVKPYRITSDAATQADAPSQPPPQAPAVLPELVKNCRLELDKSVTYASSQAKISNFLTTGKEFSISTAQPFIASTPPSNPAPVSVKVVNDTVPEVVKSSESLEMFKLLEEDHEPIVPKNSSIFGDGTPVSTADVRVPIPPTTSDTSTSDTSIFSTPKAEASSDVKTSSSVSAFGSTPVTNVAPTKPTTNIFGTEASADAKSSPSFSSFSSTSVTDVASTNSTTSIFGTKPASQPAESSSSFGSFGAPKVSTAQPEAIPVSNPAFSFKQATTTTSQPPATFSFAPKPSTTTAISGFAAAAAKAATEDGMMEDETMGGGGSVTTQQGGNIFGGGFISGLGNSPSVNSQPKSIFGGVPSNAQKSQAFSFSGGQNQAPTSAFSSFGSSAPRSSFGAAAQQAAAEQTSTAQPAFGGSPKFGASPAFGAKPTFGSPATFGAGAQQNSSVFGGGASASSGFAAFAGKSSASQPGASIFGSGASQHATTSSIFGGGTNQPSTTSTTSAFGGGNKSSFNTWR